MKYIRNALVCLLFISIIFSPLNIISANNQQETDIESYIQETYGGNGKLTINQEHMEAIRNAPKEGGVYPVEITVVENGLSATTIIYITVKPAIETDNPNESEENGLAVGPNNNNQNTPQDGEEEIKEQETSAYSFSNDVHSIRVDDYRGFSIVLYLSFLFAIFLVLMLVILYVLFRKLQVDVKKEINQLNTV